MKGLSADRDKRGRTDPFERPFTPFSHDGSVQADFTEVRVCALLHNDHCGGGPKTGEEMGSPAAGGPCIPAETVMTVPDVLKKNHFTLSVVSSKK